MTGEKQRKRRVVAPPAPAGVRLIRKYGNRRLYDTRESRYVTLGDLVDVFGSEEEVKVVDAVSGEDLTKRVLAQAILFEESRRRTQILPVKLLRDLLRHRGEGPALERRIARALAEGVTNGSAAKGARSDAAGGESNELDELKRRLRALESQISKKR
jgi:polyhydroxyalkanoate synthesis repressor PhaR